jgi:hypothetical protein
MEKFKWILGISLFLVTASYSQGHLVVIQSRDRSQIQDRKVSDFASPLRFQDNLFYNLSEFQLKKLQASGLDFQYIDKLSENHRYFLLYSRNRAELKIRSHWGKVLFTRENMAVLKSKEIPIQEIFSSGMQFSEIAFSPESQEKLYITLPQQRTGVVHNQIELVLNEINADSVRLLIQTLQDFQSRYAFASNRDTVAQWIKNRFIKSGVVDVEIDSFFYRSTWQKNVVATIPGGSTPLQVIVVGGHHDSYSRNNPNVYAPGADDNASGTAAALEMARAMMAAGYQPEVTIKFVTFAAEELGLHGSHDFARKAQDNSMKIRLMINHDMISHNLDDSLNWKVDLNYYSGYEKYLDIAANLTSTYTSLTPLSGQVNSGGSDSYSFWSRGFPAFYFEEHDFSPYWHQDDDVIENYDMDYCAEVIRASAALMIQRSEYPAEVENFRLLDAGDGSSLRAHWSANQEKDLSEYRLRIGLSPQDIDTIYSITDTLILIENLTEGEMYYAGISAIDTKGNESFVTGKYATPLTVPRMPTLLSDFPNRKRILLTWSANSEYDLAGYHIYRASDPEGEFLRVNSNPVPDSFYTDTSAPAGQFLYYKVTAVDQNQQESVFSDPVKSRIISLDGGILIVDESADGDGTILNPTDQEVDSFFHSTLKSYDIHHHDLATEKEVKLADMGGYSSVVWHANSFSTLSQAYEYQQSIKEYLDYGGKIMITSFLPTQAFDQNLSYPAEFSSGEFLYDYLKIAKTTYHPPARFNSAIPVLQGYGILEVDTVKTSESTANHLLKIESIYPAPDASEIYQYGSGYEEGSVLGKMIGEPVGIEYSGTDFQVVVLSFPLYYMQKDQAEILLNHVLQNKFNEVVSISAETVSIPDKIDLFQNYPNPFNPTTTISWQLPVNSRVKLTIYNLAGQKIVELINGQQSAGFHSVDFDASQLASGVYFYRLESGQYFETWKMMLLK